MDRLQDLDEQREQQEYWDTSGSRWRSRSRSRWRSLKRPALIVAGYLLAYFVLDLATENLSGDLEVSLWYPPAGLSLALLLICGIRYAPAAMLTAFSTYLFYRGGLEYPVWLLISLPIAHTAVHAGAALLLVRGIKIDPRLPQMRDLIYFVGVGCLAAPFAASAVGVTGYAIAGQIPWNEFVINVLGGVAGEATGVGVLTTLLLVALRPFPQLWSFRPNEPLRGFSLPARREVPEVVGQVLLLAVTLFVAYGTDRGVRLDFAYLVFLPLIWVALRNDLARTLVCVLLINVGAVVLISGPAEDTNPILIQFGLVTLTIVGLLLGGLVTERRETSEQMVQDASHDRLTGMPSRALFSETLSDALTRYSESTSDETTFAVLAVDLDRFAEINNALGHQTGDRLLVAVAGRLSAFTKESFTEGYFADGFTDNSEDPKTVRGARIGGDAFAVLVEGMDSESEAGHMAERLLEELALPYEIGGREVYATASAGVVVVGEAPKETENLLRDADTALQAAKKRGPSRYVIFDQNMSEAARERLALDTDLRRAIEREEFKLYYQPIFSLETNTVVSIEALIRWEHPERGLILPTEFIAFAEQSGLIVPIGEWVLMEACRWAEEWQEENSSENLSKSDVVVSVNLSAKQLERPGFSEYVQKVLHETGLDPSKLVLEITESVLVGGAGSVRETLGSIRGEGVRLAIDDFGTGYSSLSYLNRFPVDTIKIDRSFISRLSRKDGEQQSSAREHSADEKLVSGIIDLAHDQDLVVVAEGVESHHQLEYLRKINCDMIQGYCFSEPLAEDMVSPFMRSNLQ